MKFIRLIWFDLKNGWMKRPVVFMYPFFLALFGFLEVSRRNQIWNLPISIADYWMYLYGGMKEYLPMPGNPFTFPAIWMVLFLLGAFLVLDYPIQDLQHVGTQVLVRTRGRARWWLSKCVWNLVGSLVYHGIVLITLWLLCLWFQIPITWEVHSDVMAGMFNLFVSEFTGGGQMPLSVLVSPILFAMAVNFMQMMFTLIMKPVFAFLITCALLLSSTYLLSPFLIGNYGMAVRFQWAMDKGVSHEIGLMVSVVMIIVALIGGLVIFRKKDILNEE